jgi:site-specific recombinase XerD
MTLYSTGMRRSELVRLRVEDIDSQRMVIHIHQGKGRKDRDVPLCPRLLETLREYWRWKKPKTWLFPGQPTDGGNHLTDKAVWNTCNDAALHAGIKKRVSPHMLRHYAGFRTIPGGSVFGLIGGGLTNIFPA